MPLRFVSALSILLRLQTAKLFLYCLISAKDYIFLSLKHKEFWIRKISRNVVFRIFGLFAVRMSVSDFQFISRIWFSGVQGLCREDKRRQAEK